MTQITDEANAQQAGTESRANARPEVDGASAGTACQTSRGSFAYILTAICLGAVAALACACVLLAFAALHSIPRSDMSQELSDNLSEELRGYDHGRGGDGYSFDYGYNDQEGDGWGGAMGGGEA